MEDSIHITLPYLQLKKEKKIFDFVLQIGFIIKEILDKTTLSDDKKQKCVKCGKEAWATNHNNKQ